MEVVADLACLLRVPVRGQPFFPHLFPANAFAELQSLVAGGWAEVWGAGLKQCEDSATGRCSAGSVFRQGPNPGLRAPPYGKPVNLCSLWYTPAQGERGTQGYYFGLPDQPSNFQMPRAWPGYVGCSRGQLLWERQTWLVRGSLEFAPFTEVLLIQFAGTSGFRHSGVAPSGHDCRQPTLLPCQEVSAACRAPAPDGSHLPLR